MARRGLCAVSCFKKMLAFLLQIAYNNHRIIIIVVGMWHSLVARFVRDEEAAGSNPVIPTISESRGQPWGWPFSYA